MLILFWRDDAVAIAQAETEYRDTNDAGRTIKYIDTQIADPVYYELSDTGASQILHVLHLPRRLEG